MLTCAVPSDRFKIKVSHLWGMMRAGACECDINLFSICGNIRGKMDEIGSGQSLMVTEMSARNVWNNNLCVMN